MRAGREGMWRESREQDTKNSSLEKYTSRCWEPEGLDVVYAIRVRSCSSSNSRTTIRLSGRSGPCDADRSASVWRLSSGAPDIRRASSAGGPSEGTKRVRRFSTAPGGSSHHLHRSADY